MTIKYSTNKKAKVVYAIPLLLQYIYIKNLHTRLDKLLIFKDGNTRTFCPDIPTLFYVNIFICLKSLRYLSWCITMQDSVLLYVKFSTNPDIVVAVVRIVVVTKTSIIVRTIVVVRTTPVAPAEPVVARP